MGTLRQFREENNQARYMETLFEKFNIISCLKKTEFSAVYLADHIFLEKRIILKTLDSNKSVDGTYLSRFKREAQILAKLNHPNIIRVLDFGIFQNFVYISFEYFPAQTLREIINGKKINNTQKTNLLQQTTAGLAYAHNNNIIHRDIKPENILVDENLQLKIADFGLALCGENNQLTDPANVMGTPAYMSPEQITGSKLTAASDLFSLGLVAFELFKNNNPVLGADPGQTINNIINFNTTKLNELISKTNETEKHIIKNLLNPDPAKRQFSVELIKDAEKTDQIKQQNALPKILWISASIIMIVLFLIFYEYASTLFTPKINSESPGQIQATQENSHIFEKNDHVQQSVDSNSKTIIKKPEQIRTPTQNIADQMASLKIESIPPATIFINSQQVGNTSRAKPIELKEGIYQVTLKNDDFPDFQKNIELRAGGNEAFSINLNEHSGLLQVFAYPWAVVNIDGKKFGQTPLEKPIRLKKGLYILELKNPGFEVYKKSFEISGNDTILVQHNFNKSGFGTIIE